MVRDPSNDTALATWPFLGIPARKSSSDTGQQRRVPGSVPRVENLRCRPIHPMVGHGNCQASLPPRGSGSVRDRSSGRGTGPPRSNPDPCRLHGQVSLVQGGSAREEARARSDDQHSAGARRHVPLRAFGRPRAASATRTLPTALPRNPAAHVHSPCPRASQGAHTVPSRASVVSMCDVTMVPCDRMRRRPDHQQTITTEADRPVWHQHLARSQHTGLAVGRSRRHPRVDAEA
jgi:hypothetical protein